MILKTEYDIDGILKSFHTSFKAISRSAALRSWRFISFKITKESSSFLR